MNASFRKEAFDLSGLFSISIGPQSGAMVGRRKDLSEDVELSIKIREKTGKCIVYNPDVKVKHKVYKQRLKLSYISQWSYWMGLSKHRLKKLYLRSNKDEDVISQEHELLKSIFTKLFPNIVKGLFKNPFIS